MMQEFQTELFSILADPSEKISDSPGFLITQTSGTDCPSNICLRRVGDIIPVGKSIFQGIKRQVAVMVGRAL